MEAVIANLVVNLSLPINQEGRDNIWILQWWDKFMWHMTQVTTMCANFVGGTYERKSWTSFYKEHIKGDCVFLLLSSWAVVTMLQVISLGDIIKFSISPSTTKDSLTTNASGVPLDEKNLVCSLHIIRTSQQHCRHTSALPFSNMLAVLPSSYSLTLFASQYILYLPFWVKIISCNCLIISVWQSLFFHGKRITMFVVEMLSTSQYSQ